MLSLSNVVIMLLRNNITVIASNLYNKRGVEKARQKKNKTKKIETKRKRNGNEKTKTKQNDFGGEEHGWGKR